MEKHVLPWTMEHCHLTERWSRVQSMDWSWDLSMCALLVLLYLPNVNNEILTANDGPKGHGREFL